MVNILAFTYQPVCVSMGRYRIREVTVVGVADKKYTIAQLIKCFEKLFLSNVSFYYFFLYFNSQIVLILGIFSIIFVWDHFIKEVHLVSLVNLVYFV